MSPDDRLAGVRPEIFLAIQVVDIHYGKAHRGAAGAQTRAGLPRGLPLPIVGESGVLHQCRMSGWDGFVPRASAQEPLIRDGGASFQTHWRVELGPTELTLHHAMPRISAPVLLAASHDRWGRVRLNSRQQSFEETWFVERTINFGGFRSQPETDVFLGEPDVSLDLRRDLLRLGRRRVRR